MPKLLPLFLLLLASPAAAQQLSVETYEVDSAFVQCLITTALHPGPSPDVPFGLCNSMYARYCQAHGWGPGTCVQFAYPLAQQVVRAVVR